METSYAMHGLIDKLTNNEITNILVIGLKNSGKTTVLKQLGDITSTEITKGFEVEEVEYKNTKFTSFPMGNPNFDKIRRSFYSKISGIIYILDCTNSQPSQIIYAYDELAVILKAEELTAKPLLLAANKYDLKKLSFFEIADNFNYRRLGIIRRTYTQHTMGTTGAGLLEGLEWLFGTIEGIRARNRKVVEESAHEDVHVPTSILSTAVAFVTGFFRKP
ncbi:hypothetical protein H072_10536 [Dactylellina haptotyla CBS 200.50]|uniref:ADP-ribosylation factor n=1 Tax=Dactylellina haptotyla (strain CBS 200.50) TaxID=1284197 RepID=S8BA64_DACHA|nr:hypothetical protein H072_10536 [Dactylellina haptotyla CBS 200.50]